MDIWRIHLDIGLDSVKLFESTLSADEIRRASSFHFDKDHSRYVIAHFSLRDVLGRYLKAEPAQLKFSIDQYGKPSLLKHKLEFNLSHSGSFALVAVTQHRIIGVDVERMREGISSHSIARQYFSPAEVAEFDAVPVEQRETAFFTCWTRKEAFIKAKGLGLSLPLDSFDVSLTPNEPAILRAVRPQPQEAARWKLRSLDVAPRYAGAVAVEHAGAKNQDLEFRLWDWQHTER
ncbi:MAG TPA: 4'-phosphopantetheinyl transferase superfamily protein [Anaerolineales bacterium]|nr:4'-phosphopantetheinyl transferase superfamily protein [Anaerolineales bacterium]